MEGSLHRTLKKRYENAHERRSEVMVDGFRIDTIDEMGRLVEIQCGPLGPLRHKLSRLLPLHQMRIVKPVVLGRRVVRKARVDGPDVSARRSPKRGDLFDVFNDLLGVARMFPHPNLEIEVLGVTIEEIRISRRRRPGFSVADRRLSSIEQSKLLTCARDLWDLLPCACGGQTPFTAGDLAQRLDRPTWFAQRVAYCLRHTGAAQVVDKSGNRLIYRRAA